MYSFLNNDYLKLILARKFCNILILRTIAETKTNASRSVFIFYFLRICLSRASTHWILARWSAQSNLNWLIFCQITTDSSTSLASSTLPMSLGKMTTVFSFEKKNCFDRNLCDRLRNNIYVVTQTILQYIYVLPIEPRILTLIDVDSALLYHANRDVRDVTC